MLNLSFVEIPRRRMTTFVVAAGVGAALLSSGCQANDSLDQSSSATDAVVSASGAAADQQALSEVGYISEDLTTEVDNDPSPSATKGDRDRRKKALRARRGLRKNTLHGEITVQTKKEGQVVVVVQRGKVTAADGNSLTITSTDNFEATYTVSDDTRFIIERREGSRSDVAVGDAVGVSARRDGDNLNLRLVAEPKKK